MNLLPLERGTRRRGHRGHRRPGGRAGRLRGPDARRASRAHRARLRARRARRRSPAIEYLGADSLVTCRLGAATLAVRVPGSVGLARGDAARLAWAPGAQHLFERNGERRADAAATSHRNTMSRNIVRRCHPEENTMLLKAVIRALAGAAVAIAVGARARASAGRGVVLLPGRRRRTDHQDHRRLRRRFREGESRHQGEADLLRHLPGHDHQGADGGEERRAAGDLDPAVDRHVHADRRGCDRPVRRSHQDARRPGVAQELLPGVHGEQPDRRQDLGHSVPALDDRALLQQGDVQGSRARSRTGRRRTGRRRSSTRRSSPSATRPAR